MNDARVADGKAAGLIPQQPKAAFTVGKAGQNGVADYEKSATFDGKVTNVRVVAGSPK